MVDTPGFDDSHGNDDEIINGIVRWLEESVNRQQKLHGILYFHRIIDPKITGTSRANLRMFKKLCGNDNLGGIFLVTTFWNEVESKLGEQRELQLRGDANFWKPMIDQGSLIIRSKRDRAEDLDILSKFATRNQEFYTQAQKSIQEGKTSAQVSADCQESPTSDLIQRERKARELELTIERFRLEAVRAQKAKDLKAAIEREKAAQKKRQQEIERKQRLGQEKRQREQRAREDAERTREAKEEAEMRRLREQIARQQRLEREEAARQRRFAMHVCSNISLKRRKCSRCMNRMDWMGTGLWCWRKHLLPSFPHCLWVRISPFFVGTSSLLLLLCGDRLLPLRPGWLLPVPGLCADVQGSFTSDDEGQADYADDLDGDCEGDV